MKQEIANEALKSSPAIGGAYLTTMLPSEWSLSNTVAVVTIVYVIIQCSILLHKHYYYIKDRKRIENGSIAKKVSKSKR